MNLYNNLKVNLRKIICIAILAVAMLTFIIVNKTDAIKRSEAKVELESVVNQAYDTATDKLDLTELMDNIENNVDNSKILNKDLNQFPILAEVDGYNFKIEENGNVENINTNTEIKNDEENIISTNTLVTEGNTEKQNDVIGNTEINNNIEENTTDDNTTTEDKEIKLNYLEDTKTYKGVTVGTKSNGEVILNGTSTNKLFIKITNGIDMVTDGNVNSAVAKEEPVLIETEKDINIAVYELSGECITSNQNQQFNVVLKYDDGVIASNCKLKSNVYNQNLVLTKDISMVYLFCSENVSFNNYKIKTIISSNI